MGGFGFYLTLLFEKKFGSCQHSRLNIFNGNRLVFDVKGLDDMR